MTWADCCEACLTTPSISQDPVRDASCSVHFPALAFDTSSNVEFILKANTSMSTPASVIGAAIACAASFGVGLALMNRNTEPAEETPAPAVAAVEPTGIAESNPAAATAQSGEGDSGVMSVTSGSVAPVQPAPSGQPAQSIKIGDKTYSTEWMNSAAQAVGPIGPWKSRSGYGIPNPRLLTDREKAALNLLGKATQLHSSRFTRKTLDDGSTIPGAPPLDMAEVKRRLFDKTATKGMGPGFEEFIREVAVQNPDHFEVVISREANWADVAKVLIDARKVPGPSRAFGVEFTWYSIGDADKGDWLSFGVSSGKVRMVRAYFGSTMVFNFNGDVQNSPLVPAELVPGGRSDPDPTRAKKK